MSIKRVCFVRHATTSGNEIHSYQTFDAPLSITGRAQACLLAKRISNVSFDSLVSSTMERAQETARIIAGKTGHVPVLEPLFQEMLRPSVVRGKARTDPNVVEVINLTKAYWAMKGKHHSDEENFHDLKRRAHRALAYVTSHSEDTIVIVTHGIILKMMIAVMMFGKALDPTEFERVRQFSVVKNTGLTWCEYDNKFHPRPWQLIAWNEHAHLNGA